MGGTDHQRIDYSGASLGEAKNNDQAVAGQTPDDLVQLGGVFHHRLFCPSLYLPINVVTTF